MKRIVKERIFAGVTGLLFALMFIVPVIMINNRAVGGGFGFFVVALLVTFVFVLIITNVLSGMQLGHELFTLSKKYSSNEIMTAVKSSFPKQWKMQDADSPLSIYRHLWVMGGLGSGTPTMQVKLSDKGNTWELDVWISDYTVKNRAIKFGTKISKQRDAIDEAIAKYEG